MYNCGFLRIFFLKPINALVFNLSTTFLQRNIFLKDCESNNNGLTKTESLSDILSWFDFNGILDFKIQLKILIHCKRNYIFSSIIVGVLNTS